ncbi:MAG: GNAT family N-acetyltransferase, partial [Candidatus Bathyarchaeota archaeon]
KTLDSLPEALEYLCLFLRRIEVDYFSTCAPLFMSKRYASILNSWFCAHGASVQVAYNHMIRTGNRTFEEMKKQVFKKRAREKIRKAEREGIAFVRIDTEDSIHEWIDDIYRCNLSALERQGREGAHPDSYKDVYLSELVKTKRNLGAGFAIYGAVFNSHLVSYMIVQEFGRLMQATKAMSDTRYLRKCPNDALIAHIIRESCERGFRWFEYGFDRVKIGGRIPSLHSSINEFKFKFGFKEVPLFIYRLGLTYSGRLLQHVFSMREYAIAGSAYVPESVRNFLWRFYGPRRRSFSAFLYT